MYCKNCGRQLKEGLRFCDRCGQSVRKNNQNGQLSKREEIEELKAERLNRKRRLQEKEKKQAINKKRRKKKSRTFMFFIVAILIAILSIIIGYNMVDDTKNSQSAIPDASSTPTATATASASPEQQADKNGYAKLTISGISCIYPSSFNSNPVSGNEKLNLTDALGGANMTVTQEGKSGNVTELMRDYSTQMGGEVTYSRAGDDWYVITISLDDTIYHRKCILRNGIAVYYDFSYMASASTAQKYEGYINDIDNSFK